ncbi:hypothetical protein PIB30_099780, partial [Stylosanthes scabra]|nr:hypothetical protein [Stylosanthes scabra]
MGKQTSILLGRPFLRIAKFRLDAFSGTFSFVVGPKVIKFNVNKKMITPVVDYALSQCDVIDELVVEVQQEGSMPMIDGDVSTTQDFGDSNVPRTVEEEDKEPEKEVKADLKPLPLHLKYAYLEGDNKCP